MSEQNSDNPLQYAPSTFKSYDGVELQYRHDMVVHWFNEEAYYQIMNLPLSMRDRYFKMITDNIDVVEIIFGTVNHPMIDYIKGKPFDSMRSNLLEGEMIDYLKCRDLFAAYDEWKNRTGG